MNRLLLILLFLSAFSVVSVARADSNVPAVCCCDTDEPSWVFRASYFSHEPDSSVRVAQYTPEPTSYAREDPTYLESAYRHNQFILRGADGSVDRTHIVQTWGKGELIRPYGEWLFPYRAGATPYGPWGNPQGPWTTPFDSWQNPYGLLNHMQYQPGPYGPGGGYGSGGPGYGPGSGYGSGGPGYGSGYGGGGPMPYSAPPAPGPGGE
jgi:hypothetical protein